MALSDIRKFTFKQKYIWTPEDFENFETWMFGEIEGLLEGLSGGAVLSGMQVTPGSGLQVNMASGIACSPSGRIVVASSGSPTFTADGTNPRRSLLVLRPKITDMTSTVDPLNPPTTFYLHQKYDYDLLVLSGTPGVSPSYPSTQSDDIVVCGVYLPAAASSLTQSSFDLGVVSRPRKHKYKIGKKTASYTLDPSDEIIEADFSAASGVIQLPAALSCEGLRYTIVKVDSTSNDVAVSGQGAETISGQNVQTLDTQWQSIELLSNGVSWRII